jgi:hypothetical protein
VYLKPHGALHKSRRHTSNRPRICLESTIHLASIITVVCSLIPSVMDDGTHACMYFGHQVGRLSDHLVGIASNPPSNEIFLPQSLPILEDDRTIAWPPDILAPINYPQVTVEARYIIGYGTIPA